MTIIQETKSSRFKLSEQVASIEKKLNQGGANFNPELGGGGGSSSTPIATIIKEQLEKITWEQGYIVKVLPQTNRVFVTVRKPETSETGEYLYFNQHDVLDRKVPLAQISLPLINYDPKDGKPLEDLIDKLVEVKRINDTYYTEARLVIANETNSLLVSGITPRDMYKAITSHVDTKTYLKNLGYTDEQIDDFFKLKEEDIISKKGVLKVEGEGRQDRAYEKTSDLDIPIKENDLPKSWADRNLKPLKDKLCHNPIIAFSAR